MLLKVLILFSWLKSEPGPLSEIQIYRQEYQRIGVTEDAITKILNTSKTSTLSGTTSDAYAAAALLCSAKYKSSVFDSYKTFNKGTGLLDEVIKKDTSNVDARYIRYTIQLKAPAFLGYTAHCKRDRAFLLAQLPRLRNNDASMYALVQAFMLVHDEKAKAVLMAKNSNL